MTLNTFVPPLAHIPQTQKFLFEPEQKKACGYKSQEEETKRIQLPLKSNCWRCSVKKCVLRPATLLKRDWHRFFPVNFVKVLRTPFL